MTKYEELSECFLIKESKNGDTEAFEELVSRSRGYLFSWIHNKTKNESETEEILQITYIKCWKYIKSFKGKSGFKTWACSISRNLFIDDFRKKLDTTSNPQNTFSSISPSYKDKNIEKRVNLGDPGKKGDVSNYQKGKRDITGFARGPLDTITAFPIYRSNNVTSNFKEKNDLVKFRIAVIDPESPSKKTFIHFRAFLNNFSDGYKASWKGQKYMGRGEELYKYDVFNRDISVSFTVVAQSKEELYPMYRKLNFLASSLAPTYTKAGYMAGNLSKMTVGGYLYEQPGFISSVDYDVPNDTPWEIGIPSGDTANSVGNQGFEDSALKEMPHRIEVSLNFTPIHKFRPSINTITTPNNANSGLKDTNTYGNERFIAIADGSGLNHNGYDVRPTNDRGTTEETIE